MESEPTVLEDAAIEFKMVVRWILSGLIEAIFIVCWVFTQWLVTEYGVNRFRVSGVDETVLGIAQLLFAIATLAPIVFFLIQQLFTMTIRTYRACRKELSK